MTEKTAAAIGIAPNGAERDGRVVRWPASLSSGAAVAQNGGPSAAGSSPPSTNYPDPAWLALRQEEIIEPEIGPYKNKSAETFAQWKAGITEVAESPKVVAKLGGLACGSVCSNSMGARNRPPRPRRRCCSAARRSAFINWLEQGQASHRRHMTV